MSSWKVVKLEDIVHSINTGLDAIRRAPIVDFKTDIRCLRIQDISQSKSYFDWGFTEVKSLDYDKYQLIKGDIFIARTGNSIGVSLLIRDNYSAVFNNGLARIRVKTERVLPEFLYYVMQTKNFSQYIDSISSGTATQPNMKVGDLAQYVFKLPELDKQKTISDFFSKLDDKIQLNTQTNQTLEQIAQAIFKSWFVDFDPVKAKIDALANGGTHADAERAAMQVISGKTDAELTQMQQTTPDAYKTLEKTAALFPSEMVESELGEVPKGWWVTNFGSISVCFDNQRIPLSKQQREKKKGDIPYYGATSIMDYVDEAIFNGIYLLMGEDGSVIKNDGTPFLQYIWGRSWINNHAHVLQGKGSVSTEHLMLFLSCTNISAYVTGAVQLKLNQKNMNSIPFLLATDDVNSLFYEKIKFLYEKIRANSEENDFLIKIRDSLLPRLLSGNLG
ncbi:restriction endonuclease subunit S [Bisgaard Taxon 45]